MASIQSQFLNFYLRSLRLKAMTSKALINGKSRHEPMPAHFFDKFDVVHKGEKQRGYYLIRNKGDTSEAGGDRPVFYLHGGGYIMGFINVHFTFIAGLLKAGASEVCLVDYPVAPATKAKECLDFTLDVFQRYSEGRAPGSITIMGDSAGGGLALSIGQKLRDIGVQPKAYQLLSPWLDISMSHPVPHSIASKDLILEVDALIAAGNHYRGDLDAHDPLISPAFADLGGLAPMQMFMGGHEVFFEDGRRFAARAADADVEMDHHEYPGMQHCWQFLPIPEARVSKQSIKKFLLDS